MTLTRPTAVFVHYCLRFNTLGAILSLSRSFVWANCSSATRTLTFVPLPAKVFFRLHVRFVTTVTRLLSPKVRLTLRAGDYPFTENNHLLTVGAMAAIVSYRAAVGITGYCAAAVVTPQRVGVHQVALHALLLLLCCCVESGIYRLRRGASSTAIDELTFGSPVDLVRDKMRVFSPPCPCRKN